MDFTPELSSFQGVLISVDNVHSFSRLTARGGNEDQIDYIIGKLLRFLEQQNYIFQNEPVPEKIEKMRKFCFYIILNAELPVLEQLVENDGIGSVIWTVPTIPRCLMSEVLWKLFMERFVYEAISFSCPELALDLASALLDYIKYFTPDESLKKLYIIASALYKQICRFHFLNLENDVLTNRLTEALNNLQKCLHYFVEPPNSHKLVPTKKDQLYQFLGFRIRTMFELIHECLNDFTSMQSFSPANFNEIYQLTYKVGSYKEDSVNFAVCNSPNKSILECLEKCNIMLLDTCKVLVMEISVDIFCAWSEYEESNKSMQQTIGEICYRLRTKLLSVNILSEHPVVNMMEPISRKPIELQEVIDDADTNTILKNIEKNDEHCSKWLQALLNRENIFQDHNCIQILLSNINILNEAECHNLYRLVKAYLNDHSDNIEMVKLIAIKAFKNCSLPVKEQILQDHFPESCFNDSMQTSDFNDLTTVIFNKVIGDTEADLTDILTVFLQSPQNVYTKIFNLSTESSQAAEIMLKAMKLLERYSNHYYTQDTEPCIIRVTQTVLEDCLEREVTRQNFIKFICGLKGMNLIPGNKLLIQIIMPKLHKALLEKDVTRVHFQCKLLSKAFTLEELLAYRAPMLAMIAQVMEVVRWKIVSFVEERPAALQLAIDLQERLMETYEGAIPGNEDSWLKTKLRKLHPLNCYYYRKLWNPPGRNFLEVISGKKINPQMNEVQLGSWLCQFLSSCTQQEWCEVWDSLSALPDTHKLTALTNTLTVLTVSEQPNRTDASWQCILYCYRNYVHIVRYKYFKEPLTDDQVKTVLHLLKELANSIHHEGCEPISSVLLQLFVYIVTRKNDYTVDVRSLLCMGLRNKVFEDAMMKVVSNGS